jgi:UDP:flavonoid glycosyltransferase YjiC (YdhE family)
MYPAMGMLWLLPKNLEIPINIYYYSPAIPSYTLPWLFDSKIKESTYELYSKTNQEYNKKSWLRYYRRIAMLKGNNITLQQTLKNLNHFMCWDKFSVPKLDYIFEDLNVTYMGALINKNVIPVKLPKDVNKFIKSKKKIIYMTFGSYSNSEYLRPIFPGLMKLLEAYCVKNNAGCIYHVPNVSAFKNSDWLLNTTGFLQYEAIVRVSDLVIFTGSLCLQNICLSLATPMVMVPILTEQYFWSKNYQYFTGVPYIPTDSPCKFSLADLKKALVVNSYMKKVGKSMKATDAAQNIANTV